MKHLSPLLNESTEVLNVNMCILTLTKMSTLVSPIRYLPSETLIMGNCVGQVHLATKSRTCNKSCSKRVSQCICVRLKKDWFSPLQGHETTRYFIRNKNRARGSRRLHLSLGLSLSSALTHSDEGAIILCLAAVHF